MNADEMRCCTCGCDIDETTDNALDAWRLVSNGDIVETDIEHCDNCARENDVKYDLLSLIRDYKR